MIFSVIIPTCNRNDLLALCLFRLKPGAQTIDAELYEVIVSDDGTNNEAALLIKEQFAWVTYTVGPKRGPAANRNNGAKHATGEWLVFTDDDCLPDANWLQAYSDAILQHLGCKAFEGSILPDDWALLQKDMAECPVNTTGGCFWSANVMVEKSLFWTVGGFDERFKIAAQEDQDLQIRILEKYFIKFISHSKVYHPVRIGNLFLKINVSNKAIENFLFYANKNRIPLKYRNNRHIIWHAGIIIQVLSLIKSITNLKYKTAILSSINILLYFPRLFKSFFYK